VNTSASWSTHPVRTRPEMLSGPGDFHGLILLRALITSAVVRDRVQSSWSSASLAVGMVLLALKCVEDVELIGERGDRLC